MYINIITTASMFLQTIVVSASYLHESFAGNIWVDTEGEMNKLDNVKCIAANFLWNQLTDQFREKLLAIRNRRGDVNDCIL